MVSDFEKGAKKTIDLSVKTEKITADIFKSALQEFLNGKAEKKGRMTFRQLEINSECRIKNYELRMQNFQDKQIKPVLKIILNS